MTESFLTHCHHSLDDLIRHTARQMMRVKRECLRVAFRNMTPTTVLQLMPHLDHHDDLIDLTNTDSDTVTVSNNNTTNNNKNNPTEVIDKKTKDMIAGLKKKVGFLSFQINEINSKTNDLVNKVNENKESKYKC